MHCLLYKNMFQDLVVHIFSKLNLCTVGDLGAHNKSEHRLKSASIVE